MKRSIFTESTVSIGGPVAQPVIATNSINKGIIFNLVIKIGVGVTLEFIIGLILYS
jgi:hypothetical protein